VLRWNKFKETIWSRIERRHIAVLGLGQSAPH